METYSERPVYVEDGGLYLNDWANPPCRSALMADFEIGEAALAGVEILLASYTEVNYEGDAFVLCRRNGKLYEVNASHDSCYGLEGQWEPEETTVAALRFRLAAEAGALGDYDQRFVPELRELLDEMEKQP